MHCVAQDLIKKTLISIEQNYSIKVSNRFLQRIKSKRFSLALAELLADDSYDSLSILTIILNADETKAKEWREAIYRYVLALSYPNTLSIIKKPDLADNSRVFLELFYHINQYQKYYSQTPFIKDYPFALLTDDEFAELEDQTEYKIIQRAFRFDYIYELMKMNGEIYGYTTLEHITGVHYLALFIARQLKAKGIKIDLGTVSGAAAVHDLGKFGCLPEEGSKVAYYHYYYTEEWCYRQGLEYIRNIAVNHSTWDLELECLSIESLVLIYSDFRVKAAEDKNYPLPMKFYDLAESFAVILHKLDNVDKAKELRYKKVYNKLEDFEKYLISLGIKTSFHAQVKEKSSDFGEYSLNYNIEKIKLLSFEHSFAVLYKLRNLNALQELLYEIANCDDHLQISRYYSLLKQFSRYLIAKQKLMLLDFLFYQLLDNRENLRYQAVDLMAEIIASFDAPYSKYLPPRIADDIYKISKSAVLSDYSKRFLKAKNLSEEKTERISRALASLFKLVIKRSQDASKTIDSLLLTVKKSKAERRAILLEAFYAMDISSFNETQLKTFTSILKASLKLKQSRLIAAYLVFEQAYQGREAIDQLASEISANKYRLGTNKLSYLLNLKANQQVTSIKRFDAQKIALDNLKVSVPLWQKMINIEVIANICKEDKTKSYYWTTHLANLAQHSGNYPVRKKSAKLLAELFGQLTKAEKNDILYHLITGLEIENYDHSVDLPRLIGRLMVKLDEVDSIEFLNDLSNISESDLVSKRILVVETVGYALQQWLIMGDSAYSLAQCDTALGVLFKALIEYQAAVHLSAFKVLTSGVFDSEQSLNQQYKLLNRYLQKFILLSESVLQKLTISTLNYAYGYNKLAAFLVEYRHEVGDYQELYQADVAYFPGSFDPFSLGQKAIVEKLSSLGYAVYINVDNLQWQRRTQPALLRRRLIELSTANLPAVYLMRSLPVINLEAKSGKKCLAKLFSGRKVLIVVGEDTVLNRELYKKNKANILSLAHLVVGRHKNMSNSLQQALAKFKQAEYINIKFEHSRITASLIRDAINAGTDISDMVGKRVADEIALNNMYKNEPTFKTDADGVSTASILEKPLAKQLINEVEAEFNLDLSQYLTAQKQYIFINRAGDGGRINAFAIYSPLSPASYRAIKELNTVKSSYSEMYLENSISIDLLVARKSKILDNYCLMLNTEMLAHAHNQGFEYAVYRHHNHDNRLINCLQLAGYQAIDESDYYLTAFKKPILIILDGQTVFKTKYRKNPRMRKALATAREQLLKNIAKERAGIAILAFDRGMLYDKINKIVTQLNPIVEGQNWGDNIAVPFGEIYRRWLLPNSVTKALHTEREYDQAHTYYDIVAKTEYYAIETQVAILKAFNQPLLLIDDFVHKALRFEALQQRFKLANLEVKAIIAGIATGKGKRRIDKKGHQLYTAYFLNEIEDWYAESELYPFIGGNAVVNAQNNCLAIPSVNPILPYMVRKSQLSLRQRAEFSRICLEAAFNILKEMEASYLEQEHRSFSSKSLGEVFVSARVPASHQYYFKDEAILPSEVVAQDLLQIEQLLELL